MKDLKSSVKSKFEMHGFTLRSEASKYLLEILEDFPASEQQEKLESILDFISNQSLDSTLIDKVAIENATKNFGSAGNEEELLFKIFDAFSLIRFTYNLDSKKFLPWTDIHKTPAQLHGDPPSKADMFIEKFRTVFQRTARHRLFAAPAISTTNSNQSSFKLKAVEHLLGSSSNDQNVIVLGMLSQIKEGIFYLEDPTGAVKLNLSQTSYKGGLFTENCIVLAEGRYEDRVFHVSAIGFPPPEPAEVTLSHFPNLCVTPYPAMNSHRLSLKLKQSEQNNANAMFVFLSDVWLDQIQVMKRLHLLFSGYSQEPPTCFVFIGNFLSLPIVGSQNKTFEDCFTKLGTLISEFPNIIERSQIVFVPGPNDPGLPHIFPKSTIPSSFVGDFMRKVPKAVFTSNPCRIQYCSQDIVVFREDIISKMCRNSIYTPWQNEEEIDIPNLFVKTLIANGHLMPLPVNVAPIFWEYDHAMWLYPLPDLVVCADKYDPYTVTSAGSIFINPGSLPRSNFSFKCYFPANRKVEDSELGDEILT